jgi:hypothetical protein
MPNIPRCQDLSHLDSQASRTKSIEPSSIISAPAGLLPVGHFCGPELGAFHTHAADNSSGK